MTAGTDNYAPPAPPGTPEENHGTLARISGALFSPDETFAEIARKPNVLGPLAIVMVIAIISGIILAPRLQFDSLRAQMERTGNMAPEDVDRSVRMASAIGKVSAYASPVFLLALYLIVAGVLLLAFRLFGGEGNFTQALSVVIYAWIPRVIQSIILTIIIAAKGSMDVADIPTGVMSNPAFLVSSVDHPVLFSLLATFDLFTIWSVVLMIIGFAYISRFSKAKSATIIISLWAFVTFIKLGFAALGAMRMKQAA